MIEYVIDGLTVHLILLNYGDEVIWKASTTVTWKGGMPDWETTYTAHGEMPKAAIIKVMDKVATGLEARQEGAKWLTR